MRACWGHIRGRCPITPTQGINPLRIPSSAPRAADGFPKGLRPFGRGLGEKVSKSPPVIRKIFHLEKIKNPNFSNDLVIILDILATNESAAFASAFSKMEHFCKKRLPFSALIAAYNPVPSGQTGLGRRNLMNRIAVSRTFSSLPISSRPVCVRLTTCGSALLEEENVGNGQIQAHHLPRTHRRERIGSI